MRHRQFNKNRKQNYVLQVNVHFKQISSDDVKDAKVKSNLSIFDWFNKVTPGFACDF